MLEWLRCHLQGVVRRQGQGEAAGKEDREGVLVIIQEEGVVAERAHAQPDLREVEEVLQRQALAQVDAVRDVLAQQQRAY